MWELLILAGLLFGPFLMTYRLSTDTRNRACDAIVDDIDAGSGAGTIAIRTGAQPTNVGDADSGTLLGTLTFSDPAFNGLTQEQIFGKLASSYRANINQTLDESRRVMASQIAGTCGISAREAIDGVTELYASSSYGDTRLADDNWSVSPKLVLQKHGIVIEGEPTALELRAAFDRFFPPPPIESGVVEFPEVAAWRLFDYPSETNRDAPQPSTEHLRRSFSYLASLRDFRSLESAREIAPSPPVVEAEP